MKAPIVCIINNRHPMAGAYICNGRFCGQRCKTQFVTIEKIHYIQHTERKIIVEEDNAFNIYDDRPTVPGLGTSARIADNSRIFCLQCDAYVGRYNGGKIYFDLDKLDIIFGRNVSPASRRSLLHFLYNLEHGQQ